VAHARFGHIRVLDFNVMDGNALAFGLLFQHNRPPVRSHFLIRELRL